MDLKALTVLVVDGNRVSRKVYSKLLLKNFRDACRVWEASNGESALALCHNEAIDCVVIDYNLPDIDGLEFLKRLKLDLKKIYMPVVILTSQGDEHTAVEAMKNGAQDYLVKGAFAQELLAQAIHNAIEKVELLQELEHKRQDLEQTNDELRRANLQLKETQQQLVLQEKMASLGTLTAGIAHEINNPTNFAHGSAQNLDVDLNEFEGFLMSLVEDDADPDLINAFKERFTQLRSHVALVKEGTTRIQQILKDLQTFSRTDEAEKKRVELNECVRSTVNLVRTTYQEDVDFQCDYADHLELICWPAKLNQVFLNIIVNACQAIQSKKKDNPDREKGVLAIRTWKTDASILVSFRDTGTGMSEKIQNKIFEPFFTTKTVGDGTGLGLSVSYGIIQKHQGTIEVQSTLGEGSEFVISLPVAQANKPSLELPMTFNTLITIEQLKSLTRVHLLDCRHSLADTGAGRRAFLESHIPGAVYAHLDEDLSGPIIKGVTGRHPLPSPEMAVQNFRRLGVCRDVQVVVYDDVGGAIAARAWWMLRQLGHPAVAVLNGGWKAWLRAHQPVESGQAHADAGDFQAAPLPDMIADVDWVDRVRNDPSVMLVDSRGTERYRGEHEPIDPVAGHIPGAINLPFAENLDEQGHFHSVEMLRTRFQKALGDRKPSQTVFYCGSGVTAAHNLLAMVHADLGDAKLYPGSWSHWITDPKRPIATGT